MKGIDLAREFYEEYGKPMIENDFAEYVDRIAVGIVGHGSECFGFDDDISKDHDFEPGFCIWLTEEDEKDFGFKLFRAYRKLPKEYKGIKVENQSLFGSDNKGVHTIKEFYSFYTGSGDIPKENLDWLKTPEFYLAEATNGEVFADPVGEFTRIREGLKNMPLDVWMKKLASSCFYMAQSGQYNYNRCILHNEKTAASIALSEFVKHTAQAVFILNRTHAPYYKWMFRAMRNLPKLSNLAPLLESLMKSPFDSSQNIPVIEEICKAVADEIRAQELSDRTEDYLEPYAYCINNHIKDSTLRNMPVML
jgi:hypothetical protein